MTIYTTGKGRLGIVAWSPNHGSRGLDSTYFANIRFDTKADLESWKETFPDPSTSPAHYAKTLHINYTHVYTAADVEAGGWIRCFSRIVHLEVYSQRLYSNESEVPLVPLHGLSPVIKSLRVKFVSLPFSRIFDLILSLPLLEDLTVGSGCYVPNKTGDGSEGPPTVVYPPNPPKFTGSLEVMMAAGVEPISRRLLSLQGGIHFRKLTLRWTSEEEMSLTFALVERCSHTLESLDIMCYIFSTSIQPLYPYRWLTFVSSQAGCGRPLERDKTPRRCFSVHIAKRRMDHHGVPNHTQASRASQDLDWCSFPLDPL